MICRLFTLIAALLIDAPAPAAAVSGCAQHIPFGLPQLRAGLAITHLCKRGYLVAHDDELLIARWVAYRLRASDTLGCEQRRDNFHADPDLPKDRRATPADYAGSGYDKGHLRPAADAAHSRAQMSDTFSMANMAPQVAGLNRQQWERLEETARAWAYDRGEVLVTVGPVIDDKPKTIGRNKVAVPQAFWKTILDPATDAAIAFVLPQRAIAKGPLAPWQFAISDVEGAGQIALPLPAGIDRMNKPALWPADIKAWSKAKKQACAR